MTDTRRANQGRAGYRWGRWTIGLGVLALVIGAAAVGVGQPPSSAAALAWSDEAASSGGMPGAALLRDGASSRVVSSATSTFGDASLPVGDLSIKIVDQATTPAPTATRQPIATSTATATPWPTASRKLVKSAASGIIPTPDATLTPLNFSFYAKAICATRKIQNLTLMITAHGGQPPYDYYNDDVVLAKSEKGSVKYSRDAPAGNPVPYKIIIVDSIGQRYSEDFFFKSHLSCGF